MNGKFFDLNKEKQDRMINAALKVFAQNGYRHASTDDIVREAGISKGLLFHYFGSKVGIYAFAYEYSVRYMMLELNASVDRSCSEPFTLMKQVQSARMHALRGYPYMQQFLDRSLSEDVSEALVAVEDKKNLLAELYEEIRGRMDFGKLSAGLTKEEGEKLCRIVELALNGLAAERFRAASFQPEMAYEEAVGYLELMEKLVYQRE